MQQRHWKKLIEIDPHLSYFEGWLEKVDIRVNERLNQLQQEGGLLEFSRTYQKQGFHLEQREGQQMLVFREWLPEAEEVHLIGDFNGWSRSNPKYRLSQKEYGYHEIVMDKQMINSNDKVKLQIKTKNGQYIDKIPAWIRYALQNEGDKSYDGVYVESKYQWKENKKVKVEGGLRIYECHIGMAGTDQKVHSYKEFTKNVLPRVKENNYNCLQIMGLIEHSYYGSFGYHVTNFHAVSSRYGSIDDLKELIDTAHEMGIIVLLDIVHSHASKNWRDGLNMQDGTEYQYFHDGEKGNHALWDSKLFDYGKYEVLRFLLGNLAYWMDEFRIDGFRFDGVTSMLYTHHGLSYGFTGDYHEYFNDYLDIECVTYLVLANALIKQIDQDSICIAEDVSGLPGLAQKVENGGVGFDYRLAMAIPDMWIKLLKEQQDEEWDIGQIVHTLTNRRYDEKVICYAESHDQALVGDKTISMWLFNELVYTNMRLDQENERVFRGIQLHKVIRMMTLLLGGDGYLNFMGNEFGHPEWIDFPREGNGWSYDKCRRRWDLVDDQSLRYHQLNQFDKAMLQLTVNYQLFEHKSFISLVHPTDKLVAFTKNELLFIINLHPSQSFPDYRIGCNHGQYDVIFDTDQQQFGGHSRIQSKHYQAEHGEWDGKQQYIVIYLPSRSLVVLKPS